MSELIYQDDHLLIVTKPADLLSVPGKAAQDNLFDRLRRQLPHVRLIHRLDMATSGLMVFALNHASQAALSRQFERRSVRKVYCALVEGRVAEACGETAMPLICDWPRRPLQKVDWVEGKPAHTFYRVRRRFDNRTLLELHPTTGRSHQLRVHCLSIGHPIVGDRFYAPESIGTRLMLHAESLQLTHPHTQEPLQFYSPAPFFDSTAP